MVPHIFVLFFMPPTYNAGHIVIFCLSIYTSFPKHNLKTVKEVFIQTWYMYLPVVDFVPFAIRIFFKFGFPYFLGNKLDSAKMGRCHFWNRTKKTIQFILCNLYMYKSGAEEVPFAI